MTAAPGTLAESVHLAITLTQSWLLHAGSDTEEWRQLVDLAIRLTWPDEDPVVAVEKALLSFIALTSFLADQVARATTDGKPSFDGAHRVLAALDADLQEHQL